MRRTLPTFEIEGTHFIVDVDFQMLRHPFSEEKVIPFGEMEDKGSNYLLQLDSKEQVAADRFTNSRNILSIEIPPMVQLDPEGIAWMYNLEKDALPERDEQLKCDPGLLRMRHKGKRPTINICGHTYFADWHRGMLWPKDKITSLGLETGRMEHDDSRTLLLCFYDPKTQQAVEIDEHIRELPEGIVPLEIPDWPVLDPYRYGERMDVMDMDGWLNLHPVRYNLRARQRPWNKTFVPRLVRENLQKSRIHGKRHSTGRRI